VLTPVFAALVNLDYVAKEGPNLTRILVPATPAQIWMVCVPAGATAALAITLLHALGEWLFGGPPIRLKNSGPSDTGSEPGRAPAASSDCPAPATSN
jgi:hypothetical protein